MKIKLKNKDEASSNDKSFVNGHGDTGATLQICHKFYWFNLERGLTINGFIVAQIINLLIKNLMTNQDIFIEIIMDTTFGLKKILCILRVLSNLH